MRLAGNDDGRPAAVYGVDFNYFLTGSCAPRVFWDTAFAGSFAPRRAIRGRLLRCLEICARNCRRQSVHCVLGGRTGDQPATHAVSKAHNASTRLELRHEIL